MSRINNELRDFREWEILHFALERLLEDTHEDSEYSEEEIVAVIDKLDEVFKGD
jgi:hypothetical protein